MTMTNAFENKSARDMLALFNNVIDHGTAAHADALFLELKQASQQTRDDVYTLLQSRALEQAGSDIAAWNDFQWKQGPALDAAEYAETRRKLLKDFTRLKPLAQIFYRLSQHQGEQADKWIRNFGEEFSIMTSENKNSPEALADSFAATKRLPEPKSPFAFAHSAAATKPSGEAKDSRDTVQKNHQQLKDIATKRKINTGMQP
jgi:hypothetical protein